MLDGSGVVGAENEEFLFNFNRLNRSKFPVYVLRGVQVTGMEYATPPSVHTAYWTID
jgi:hypothetical protein